MGSLFSPKVDTPETPTPVEETTVVDSESAAKNKAARRKKTTDYSMGSMSTPSFTAKGRSTLGGA